MATEAAHPKILPPPPTGIRLAPGKWLVASSVMIGTFLSVMDATVVNVAIRT